MALHYRLSDKDDAVVLKTAMKALQSANSQQTAAGGDIYIPNYDENGFRDGTGTYIGSGSIGNGGVVQWVGDTTAPGIPTGVSASSAWGVIYAKWDGTLDGGVPDDFAYVLITMDDVEVGKLTEAGTVAVDGYENGQNVLVGFTAYDAAHDKDGNLAPNASDTATVQVTVVDERDEIDEQVDAIEQAADEAKQTATEAWDKAESVATTVEDSVQTAVDAAQQAQSIANDLSDTITDVTATVNGVQQDVDELTTTVSGMASDVDEALTAATEAKQTATEISSTASEALDTANEALTQSSEAKQTADSISATLESDYVSKADADETYATKTELEATSDGLTASITEAASTADAAMSKATEVEATAEQISTTLTSDYLTKSDAETTYATQSSVTQTADEIRSEVSAAAETADEAMEKATSAEQTVDGISTSVTEAVSTAEDALEQAATAQQTVDSFKTEVSETYATKSDLDDSIAQEVLDRNSAIEQSATEITQTVSETYQPKGDYLSSDDLSIGGTNVLRNTKFFTNDGVSSSENGYLISGATVQSETYQGFTVRGATKSTSNNQLADYLINEFELGETYTLSFYVKGSVETVVDAFFFGSGSSYVKVLPVASSGTAMRDTYGDGKTQLPVTTEWTRVYVTWQLADEGSTSINKYALIRNDDTSSGATVYICGCKLERGTVATDWSPSPDDYTTTDELDATYATQSSVTQTADSILSEVSTTYVSQSDADATYATKSYVDQQDDSITSTVSEAVTTADSALNKASTVEQTVDGVTVRLTEAENDIDTAQSTAEDAADAAEDAAKVATNYLSYTSDGLVVGDMTKSTLGANTRITPDGMEIRNGSTVNASFTEDTISLGANSDTATIGMCGDTGIISQGQKEFNNSGDGETIETIAIGNDSSATYKGSILEYEKGSDTFAGIVDPTPTMYMGDYDEATPAPAFGVFADYIILGAPREYCLFMDMETFASCISAAKAIKKSGESMTAFGYYGGFITASGKVLQFSIPCTYATDVSDASASSSWSMYVRADGDYEVGSSSSATSISASDIEITPRAYQHLDVKITFSTARTNNIAVGVQISSGTIRFS